MKRVYSLMPNNVAEKVRNFLEFDGGVTDTHVFRASNAGDAMYGQVYRPPPASMPQARIPQGPLDRAYDIKYYTRDVRRGPLTPTTRLIEESFTRPEHFKGATAPEPALPASIDVPVAKPIDGSMRNDAVERYDKSGLRVTMTANEAAYMRELAKHRAEHLPGGSWGRSKAAAEWQARMAAAGLPPAAGVQTMKRISPWQYTHATQW